MIIQIEILNILITNKTQKIITTPNKTKNEPNWISEIKALLNTVITNTTQKLSRLQIKLKNDVQFY